MRLLGKWGWGDVGGGARPKIQCQTNNGFSNKDSSPQFYLPMVSHRSVFHSVLRGAIHRAAHDFLPASSFLSVSHSLSPTLSLSSLPPFFSTPEKLRALLTPLVVTHLPSF